MIIVQFGFTKLSVSNGFLYGKHVDFPIKTLRLLIATVTYLPRSTGSLVRNTLDGLAQNDQWLIENSRQVDEVKRKAYHDTTDYLEMMNKSGREHDQHTIQKLRKENSDLKNENRHLKYAFEALKK